MPFVLVSDIEWNQASPVPGYLGMKRLTYSHHSGTLMVLVSGIKHRTRPEPESSNMLSLSAALQRRMLAQYHFTATLFGESPNIYNNADLAKMYRKYIAFIFPCERKQRALSLT